MNLRATCVNPKCPAKGVERSVLIGKFSGFGAPNDRVICPVCGELMRTTKSIDVSTNKRSSKTRVAAGRKWLGRSEPTRTRKRPTTKRTAKRGATKR